MFRAVNTDSELQKKERVQERKELIAAYTKCQNEGIIEPFMDKKVEYESNKGLLENGKSNLLCEFIRSGEIQEIENKIDEYSMIETKYPLFSLINRYLVEKRYIRAKKLLNIARAKGWYCNELYNTEAKLNKLVFGEEYRKDPEKRFTSKQIQK